MPGDSGKTKYPDEADHLSKELESIGNEIDKAIDALLDIGADGRLPHGQPVFSPERRCPFCAPEGLIRLPFPRLEGRASLDSGRQQLPGTSTNRKDPAGRT